MECCSVIRRILSEICDSEAMNSSPQPRRTIVDDIDGAICVEIVDYDDISDEDEPGSSSRYAYRHNRRKSANELKCNYCPKRYTTGQELALHMEYCQNSRPHECQVCTKRFKTRSGLQQHNRIHTQERPYGCRYCDKCFTQKSHVDQHERIHTGEKPFVCAVCGRAFRQRSQQMQHEATHTKED